METNQYIVALEIGSSKITGAVATKSMQGDVTVLAIETERVVDCIRYGCIQNVEETNTRINRIIKKLENRNAVLPRKIKSVYVGVNARSIRNIVNNTVRELNEESAITNDLINNIYAESQRTQFVGYDVLAVSPISLLVDKTLTKNPIGMFASQIDAKLNLIVAKSQIKTNLKRVMDERLQLPVNAYLTTPTCVADAILTQNERQLGCMLVDFGAELTTVAIYKNDALQYLSSLPIGSRNITRDITSLKVLEESAEEIKKSIGSAIATENESTKINIDGVNASDVSNYIVARTGEIIANIIEQIAYAELTADDIPEGVVLIGGGSKLNGFAELLEQQSKLKVRKGRVPESVHIIDKNITTGIDNIQIISLLKAGADHISSLDTCCAIPEGLEQIVTPEVQPQKPQQRVNEQPKRVEKRVVDEPEQAKSESKPNLGSRFFSKLKHTAENLFNENAYDDDDDNNDKK